VPSQDENERAGSPLKPGNLKPVCGYPRRVSPFRDSCSFHVGSITSGPAIPEAEPGSTSTAFGHGRRRRNRRVISGGPG
jgi:hypothetical protein